MINGLRLCIERPNPKLKNWVTYSAYLVKGLFVFAALFAEFGGIPQIGVG